MVQSTCDWHDYNLLKGLCRQIRSSKSWTIVLKISITCNKIAWNQNKSNSCFGFMRFSCVWSYISKIWSKTLPTLFGGEELLVDNNHANRMSIKPVDLFLMTCRGPFQIDDNMRRLRQWDSKIIVYWRLRIEVSI